MGIQLHPVQTPEEIRKAAALADEIWHQHYGELLGKEQVDYMVEKFQSETAIANQLEEGAAYVLALEDGEPVGYCAYYPEKERMFLSKIYLQKAVRGRGIARRFLGPGGAGSRGTGLARRISDGKQGEYRFYRRLQSHGVPHGGRGKNPHRERLFYG